MKKIIFIALLAITSISTFGQTLSKEETIEYIKTRLLISTKYVISCDETKVPSIEKILDVRAADGKLFIDTEHVIVYSNGNTGNEVVSTIQIALDGKFVANPTNDCNKYVYNIGGKRFYFPEVDDAKRDADVKSLAKALNYLSTLCKDPFQ